MQELDKTQTHLVNKLKQVVADAVLERVQSDTDGTRFVWRQWSITSALSECERAGLTRRCDVLRDAVKPWYEMLGRNHPFVHRVQTWPAGYPGDAATIAMILAGVRPAQTNSPLTAAIDRFYLNLPVVQQHRNKVRRQTELILETIARKSSSPIRVLVVACGTAPDVAAVRDILALFPNAQVVLNDMDQSAVSQAWKALTLPTEPEPRASYSFFVGNIVALSSPAKRSTVTDNRGQHVFTRPFDLIVAGGLFDYLPDKFACALIASLSSQLHPDGGCFFFTNLDDDAANRTLRNYTSNWTLIERTLSDLDGLTNGVDSNRFTREFETDTSGQTHYVYIRSKSKLHSSL